MTLRIGFTNKFYTLWDVSTEKVSTGLFSHYNQTNYCYFQNLSFSKAQAIAKAKAKGCTDLEVDDTLRGQNSSWSTRGPVISDVPEYCFPTGLIEQYMDIRDCTNTSALWVMYLKKDMVFAPDSDYADWKRPVVYARRQLINLGILNKYKGQWVTDKYKDILIAREVVEATIEGHHEEDKKRVSLELKEIGSHSFESEYGTCFIITYADKQNRKFTYMGNSPKDISTDSFDSVKATIKHDSYKGKEQTKLQRIAMQ